MAAPPSNKKLPCHSAWNNLFKTTHAPIADVFHQVIAHKNYKYINAGQLFYLLFTKADAQTPIPTYPNSEALLFRTRHLKIRALSNMLRILDRIDTLN